MSDGSHDATAPDVTRTTAEPDTEPIPLDFGRVQRADADSRIKQR